MENPNSNLRFTELEVWKKARQLKLDLKQIVKDFPAEEKYRLSDQLTRASRGVGACIAEGHGRFTYKDQVHFCIIARGSLSEILHHLADAFDEKIISKQKLEELNIQVNEVEKLLNGYINWLRKQNK